ncbi:hypothetical protein Pla8534_58960 [Lignipirellula cremea]|uniref:LPS-assembly protein LptD n=1 Tax=Lignipirellula cremea TaxID=2528010 RepID=A0A518E1R6_9BACT|nr:hypothetical protein Pla8534_58960 [Lignipirellula cremea]
MQGQQIDRLAADPRFAIAIKAEHGEHWRQGGYEVWRLQGDCVIKQGGFVATADQAVIWIDRAEAHSGRPSRAILYLEQNVVIDSGVPQGTQADAGPRTWKGPSWLGRLHSFDAVEIRTPVSLGRPAVIPAIYQRGVDARSPVQQAQFTTPAGEGPPARRIIVRPRSNVRVQGRVFPNPQTGEQIAVITTGVRVVVEGADALGKLDIETDRIVIWAAAGLSEAVANGESRQSDDLPLEFYLEGNIVFRQGDRVIYAQRMYYNVAERRGVVLDAEVLTPVPEYQGLLRLKADVLQQLDANHFIASGGAVTSSRLGVPQYWFQSDTVEFEDLQFPQLDPFTGQPAIDPETGDVRVEHKLRASSRNNFLYLGGVPVLYWPVLETDLTKPTFYVDSVRVRSDSVFGTQFMLDVDAYQLFGIRDPLPDSDWGLSLDYLSLRGPAGGTDFSYKGSQLFGLQGPFEGQIEAWGVIDHGLDNLGADRRALVPEATNRGRVFGQHRQVLPSGLQISAEVGLITDRNFLEQYYEQEWDQQKDHVNAIEIKQFLDNQSLSLYANAHTSGFFNQTQSTPRVDHYLLGQPLLNNSLTWNAHTYAGYEQMRVPSTPTDPVDAAKFRLLAWEADREGLVAGTRQEINAPLEAGPVKLTPYALGDASYWGDDLTGTDVARLYGQVGLRSSISMWKSDPTVRSELYNLNGLAHKVVFESDIFFAEADQDISRFPLYDPLDDDSQEAFRRRYFFDDFGGGPGNIPIKFDERYFALRSGMQGNVTAPSAEIADDLFLAKFGVRQRWQTRRGLPGQERVVDWIVLDIDAIFYPKPDRDNFGASVGMIDYDFKWHVGDRLTILSDGYMDTFDDGLRTISIGGLLNRPGVGRIYVGARSIEGPISSSILSGSFSYRMSEKWIATAGGSYDFGPTGNIGQTLAFTRIGESYLLRLGLNVDVSRGNVGLAFAVEPRFLPSSRLGNIGGVQIPPAGVMGLE